ncbi:hypothetical protein GZH46_01645 [Fragariocoptes setiger]|uniref:PDZ domain-containing protein n=1 Tax=Fragariocoptes setiger TaxID=1670756 RepID=A0ABQ7S8T1_9ACAR|nr:hypothetical protein GZH46_01645 [Fragariocoptes setiger]
MVASVHVKARGIQRNNDSNQTVAISTLNSDDTQQQKRRQQLQKQKQNRPTINAITNERRDANQLKNCERNDDKMQRMSSLNSQTKHIETDQLYRLSIIDFLSSASASVSSVSPSSSSEWGDCPLQRSAIDNTTAITTSAAATTTTTAASVLSEHYKYPQVQRREQVMKRVANQESCSPVAATYTQAEQRHLECEKGVLHSNTQQETDNRVMYENTTATSYGQDDNEDDDENENENENENDDESNDSGRVSSESLGFVGARIAASSADERALIASNLVLVQPSHYQQHQLQHQYRHQFGTMHLLQPDIANINVPNKDLFNWKPTANVNGHVDTVQNNGTTQQQQQLHGQHMNNEWQDRYYENIDAFTTTTAQLHVRQLPTTTTQLGVSPVVAIDSNSISATTSTPASTTSTSVSTSASTKQDHEQTKRSFFAQLAAELCTTSMAPAVNHCGSDTYNATPAQVTNNYLSSASSSRSSSLSPPLLDVNDDDAVDTVLNVGDNIQQQHKLRHFKNVTLDHDECDNVLVTVPMHQREAQVTSGDKTATTKQRRASVTAIDDVTVLVVPLAPGETSLVDQRVAQLESGSSSISTDSDDAVVSNDHDDSGGFDKRTAKRNSFCARTTTTHDESQRQRQGRHRRQLPQVHCYAAAAAAAAATAATDNNRRSTVCCSLTANSTATLIACNPNCVPFNTDNESSVMNTRENNETMRSSKTRVFNRNNINDNTQIHCSLSLKTHARIAEHEQTLIEFANDDLGIQQCSSQQQLQSHNNLARNSTSGSSYDDDDDDDDDDDSNSNTCHTTITHSHQHRRQLQILIADSTRQQAHLELSSHLSDHFNFDYPPANVESLSLSTLEIESLSLQPARLDNKLQQKQKQQQQQQPQQVLKQTKGYTQYSLDQRRSPATTMSTSSNTTANTRIMAPQSSASTIIEQQQQPSVMSNGSMSSTVSSSGLGASADSVSCSSFNSAQAANCQHVSNEQAIVAVSKQQSATTIVGAQLAASEFQPQQQQQRLVTTATPATVQATMAVAAKAKLNAVVVVDIDVPKNEYFELEPDQIYPQKDCTKNNKEGEEKQHTTVHTMTNQVNNETETDRDKDEASQRNKQQQQQQQQQSIVTANSAANKSMAPNKERRAASGQHAFPVHVPSGVGAVKPVQTEVRRPSLRRGSSQKHNNKALIQLQSKCWLGHSAKDSQGAEDKLTHHKDSVIKRLGRWLTSRTSSSSKSNRNVNVNAIANANANANANAIANATHATGDKKQASTNHSERKSGKRSGRFLRLTLGRASHRHTPRRGSVLAGAQEASVRRASTPHVHERDLVVHLPVQTAKQTDCTSINFHTNQHKHLSKQSQQTMLEQEQEQQQQPQSQQAPQDSSTFFARVRDRVSFRRVPRAAKSSNNLSSRTSRDRDEDTAPKCNGHGHGHAAPVQRRQPSERKQHGQHVHTQPLYANVASCNPLMMTSTDCSNRLLVSGTDLDRARSVQANSLEPAIRSIMSRSSEQLQQIVGTNRRTSKQQQQQQQQSSSQHLEAAVSSDAIGNAATKQASIGLQTAPEAKVGGQLVKINAHEGTQVVELWRTAGVPWGFFVANGALENVKGVFVTRIHDELTLAGLIDIGDQIVAIDGHKLEPHMDVMSVNQLMRKKHKICIKLRPFNARPNMCTTQRDNQQQQRNT